MKKISTSFMHNRLIIQKRINIIIFTILVLCSVILSGCKKIEEEPPVEITIVSGWGGTFQSHKVMREIYEEFDRQNPDIVLNCVAYSDNAVAVENAIDMLAVGNVPDIVSTNGFSNYLEYAVKCDEVMDLMPYIEEDKAWKEQIHPAVFDAWMTEQGELYTIPDALEVAGYWYNEEYLIQAGVVDENGSAAVPKTWLEFMDMLEKVQLWITENQREESVFALEEDQIKGSLFLARLAGDSEEGFEAANSSNPVLNEALIKNTVSDLDNIRRYGVEVDNIEEARNIFLDGKSVLFFGGVWESFEFEKSIHKGQFQYANYPTCNGKSLSYVSASSGYVIAKQSDEKKEEACIRFLKYILSKDVQERIALMTNQAPSNASVDMDKIIKENQLLGQALEVAYSADIQIKTIYSVWNESQVSKVREIIYN